MVRASAAHFAFTFKLRPEWGGVGGLWGFVKNLGLRDKSFATPNWQIPTPLTETILEKVSAKFISTCMKRIEARQECKYPRSQYPTTD